MLTLFPAEAGYQRFLMSRRIQSAIFSLFVLPAFSQVGYTQELIWAVSETGSGESCNCY